MPLEFLISGKNLGDYNLTESAIKLPNFFILFRFIKLLPILF